VENDVVFYVESKTRGLLYVRESEKEPNPAVYAEMRSARARLSGILVMLMQCELRVRRPVSP